MDKLKYYEIFLTEDNVSEETWVKFLFYLAVLNGLFVKWKIIIRFENNVVRYFLKTRKDMPTTITDLNAFLLKKDDNFSERKVKFFKGVLISKNKEKSIVDIYDKNESRRLRTLEEAQLTFWPFKRENYLTKINLIFKNAYGKNIFKKLLFGLPHRLLSIDFSVHTRFLCKRETKKYLSIEKCMKIFESDRKNSILKVDAFPFLQDNYFLNLNNYDFDKHSLVIGGSGTGKSKFLGSFVKSIYDNPNYRLNYKIVIIDPHSSLEDDIGGLSNTRVIDFKTRKNSIDLFINSNENLLSDSEILLNLLKSLMADEYNSKLERVLRHSILILMSINQINLNNMKKLIIDANFRNLLFRENKNIPEASVDFFLNEFFEIKNKSYTEAIAPIISFIDEMSALPAISRTENLESLKNIIDENFLSIISLDETAIGEKSTKTIAGLILNQIFSLMQKRLFDEHIILIIDEVAIIQNPIIKRFLSESRKYNVSIMLAGQYFNQLEEDIQKAVFANIVNYYSFRVSREDAAILSKNMQMTSAVHDTYFTKMKMLSELANRECILRVSSNR